MRIKKDTIYKWFNHNNTRYLTNEELVAFVSVLNFSFVSVCFVIKVFVFVGL